MNRGRVLAQLARLLKGELPRRADWPGVVALAGEQFVLAQLYAPLSRAQSRVPPDLWSFLVEVRRRTRARNARLYETLGDALAALNAAGVQPILLKGCAGWAVAAPADSDRLVSDLDLLVEPAEMDAAVEALTRAGFAVLEDDRDRSHDVVVLGRAADVGAIDLHQHLPGPRDVAKLEPDQIRTVTFDRGVARVLSPELQILTAAVHDQLHDAHLWRGGFDVRRLLDIAAVAAGPVDWPRLAAMCRTPQLAAALTAQLHAAHRLAGAPIPNTMLGGVWGALLFQRQRLQFAWPWLNTIFDAVRSRRGPARMQHSLWSWLMRRTAGRFRSA